MTSVPFDLPVGTGDAGALARILYEYGNRSLTDDLRKRLSVRARALKLKTIRPYFGSLERDPIHRQAFFLAVDGIDSQPLLMRFAPASTPSSGLFPHALLIARLRVASQETVISAVPFGLEDSERIRTFVWQVSPSFLPRIQGSRSTLSVPAQTEVFEHFRATAKPLGLNIACLSGPLEAILWEAVRSGWREGYSAESSDPSIGGYSRYILPYSPELLSTLEAIARARVRLKLARTVDWELQLEDSVSTETAEEILDEARAAGKPAQYVGFTSGKPPLAGPDAQAWLALACRQNFAFSFSGLDHNPAALMETARTLGRFNYRAGPGADPRELARMLFG